jgi:serine/threonine protein kinase
MGSGVPFGQGAASAQGRERLVTARQKFGRYEILAELGRGAMGVVYKANDPVLDRLVAIKTIDMAFDREGMKEYAARFYQEGKAAGGLSHPNVVTIYDVGESGDVAYMAMEFIDGVELRSLLSTGRAIPVARAVSIAAQVAEGLGYAHQRGVVHRDVKPANVMVPRTGPVKITDFGIARMRSSEVLTQTGTMLGSPKYMSPEQVLGKRADHRSDIFSLGVIVYEMLAGVPPFSGDTVAALMYQTVNVEPRAPSALNPAVPPMLDLIVAKTLSKSLDDRYQSALDVARDLRELEATLPPAAQAPEPASVAAPEPLDADTSMINLAKTIEPSSGEVAAEAGLETPSPTRGVSRHFDSLEATQRLAVLKNEASDATAQDARSALATTVALRTARPWGRRETSVVAAAALAGLIVAAAIVLA